MNYALITGSTKGIGKEIDMSLLENDYYVIFNYYNYINGQIVQIEGGYSYA